ncbi:hypothetical protein SLA2020_337620 [Shorea laevis]
MDGSKGKMLGSTEDASSGSTQSGGATSADERVCYCGRPMIVRTAHTDQNYGRRFVSCENWKIKRECGFFEWLDPKMCEHGRRVVSRLKKWHDSLKEEAKQCQTMVEVEVEKVKGSMEVELSQYRKDIEIGQIKLQAMKNNYQTIIVCSWIFFAMYLFFFGIL